MTSKAPQQTEIENEIGLVPPHAACHCPTACLSSYLLSSHAPFRDSDLIVAFFSSFFFGKTFVLTRRVSNGAT